MLETAASNARRSRKQSSPDISHPSIEFGEGVDVGELSGVALPHAAPDNTQERPSGLELIDNNRRVIDDESPGRSFYPPDLRSSRSSRYKELDVAKHAIEEIPDELEALKRSIILSRQNVFEHEQKLELFQAKIKELERYLGYISQRSKLSKELKQKADTANGQFRELLAFYKTEQRASEVAVFHEEQGLRPNLAETIHAIETDDRQTADQTLIPTYLETKKRLHAAQKAQEPYTNLLKRRLGEVVPEELEALAEDPSSLGIVRRGWEWMKSKFDKDYQTTTQLLHRYRERAIDVNTIEEKQQALRRQIEGITLEEAPASSDRINVGLGRISKRVEALVKEKPSTPHAMEDLVFSTQQMEARLAEERPTTSYRAVSPLEHTLQRAQNMIQDLREEALLDARRPKEPADLLARELVLFSDRQIALESRQFTHLSRLLTLDPLLQDGYDRLIDLFTVPNAEEVRVQRIKIILRDFTPIQKQILVTLTKHWTEHVARVKKLRAYNATRNDRKANVDIISVVQHVSPEWDIVKVSGIQPIEARDIDTLEPTTQSRIGRLVKELEATDSAKKLGSARAYERFLTLWQERPFDAALVPPATHKLFQKAWDAIAKDFPDERGFCSMIHSVYSTEDLRKRLDLKQDTDALIKNILSHGIPFDTRARYRLDHETATRVLHKIIDPEVAFLLPTDILAQMTSDTAFQEISTIYRLYRDARIDRKDIAVLDIGIEAREHIQSELQGVGLDESEAFLIADAIARERTAQLKQVFEQAWETLPTPVQEAFSKKNDLYLVSILSKITQRILKTTLGDPSRKVTQETLDRIFHIEILPAQETRKDIQAALKKIRALYQA